MWRSHSDYDIRDFALPWEPLGVPAPENVAAAVVIDGREYSCRLLATARFHGAHLHEFAASSERLLWSVG